jgi:hypothetical protein
MSDDLDRLAEAIREIDAGRLDPDRRARMRRRVLAADLSAARPIGVRRLWRRAAIAAAVLGIVSIGVGGAAGASLPGDPAFPLKIQAEKLQLLLSPDLYRRLDQTLEQADRRLDELLTLSRRDVRRLGSAADAYGHTLGDVRAAVEAMAASEHADRARALEEAGAELDRHVARLVEIRASTDGEVERALAEARGVDQRIKEIETENEGDRAAPTGAPATGGASGSTPAPAGTARPTRTPEPNRTPDPTRTPDSTRTPDPTRTPDATRTPDPTQTPARERNVEPTRTPDATRTPDPSRTPDGTRTPSPSASTR